MSKKNDYTQEAPKPGVKAVDAVLEQLADLSIAVKVYEDSFSDFERSFIKDQVARSDKYGVNTRFSLKQENLVQKIYDKIPA
jgi:hypothetical protein